MTTDKAIELARVMARQLFKRRGNHSEVHLSEAEVTALLALAIERGAKHAAMTSNGGRS